jgi:hypothetical protein
MGQFLGCSFLVFWALFENIETPFLLKTLLILFCRVAQNYSGDNQNDIGDNFFQDCLPELKSSVQLMQNTLSQ